MTENRLYAGWLRSLTGLVAVAGVLGLSACGGGSGAPNNFFTGTLTVLPASAIAYSGVPMTLTISGGSGPYRAFSSNSALLPVPSTDIGKTFVLNAGNVVTGADTDVTITVQDTTTLQPAAAQASVTVTVRAAPLVNSLTITPNLAECGTTAICSGQNGTASVTVLGPQGGPILGRAVRYDVLGTAYSIATTNPAQPFVSSLIVFSDANGVASVIIKANVSAPTQFVQLTATDLTSGQQLTGNFIIQQLTDGSTILTVVPPEAKITGAFLNECSTGFHTDYYIYGGTPPYRVTSTFPNSITLLNSIVAANGGFFEAVTNGSCVNPLTFSILDATGRQTTATLINEPGTTARPVVVAPPLAIAPPSATVPSPPATVPPTVPPIVGCAGKTFQFIATGGTPPYSAILTPQSAPAANVTTSGNSIKVSGITEVGAYSVTVFDQSSPQKTAIATITCS